MPFKIARYGWKRDQPDHRDMLLRVPSAVTAKLPKSVDLRVQMPAIFDQGDLGSCTANATGMQAWHIDKTVPVEPSRLFIYYNTRVLEGTVNVDSGASIRNSVKAVVTSGIAPEPDWPYDISKFRRKPPAQAYKNARAEKVLKYARVAQSPEQLKAQLAQGYTVNFGFSVYESFESTTVTKTGIVPMPSRNESILGGHAVLLVGYDDNKNRYIVQNSWGKNWGDAGYCYMPYDYVHNRRLAADFWTIMVVT